MIIKTTKATDYYVLININVVVSDKYCTHEKHQHCSFDGENIFIEQLAVYSAT